MAAPVGKPTGGSVKRSLAMGLNENETTYDRCVPPVYFLSQIAALSL